MSLLLVCCLGGSRRRWSCTEAMRVGCARPSLWWADELILAQCNAAVSFFAPFYAYTGSVLTEPALFACSVPFCVPCTGQTWAAWYRYTLSRLGCTSRTLPKSPAGHLGMMTKGKHSPA